MMADVATEREGDHINAVTAAAGYNVWHPVCKLWVTRNCLFSLRQRIRSQVQALAEMKIRASWSL